ncbi:MAG TPA: alpha/beta fold hydrolase [Bacteroidia bacterium]
MKTIFFLHGALGSANDWNKVIQLLENEVNCIAIDFPGHGQYSESNNANSIGQLSAYLRDKIAEVKSNDIAIVGYSMGGYVALNLAASGGLQEVPLLCLAVKLNWNEQIAEQEASGINETSLTPIIDALKTKHGENYHGLFDRTVSVLRSIGTSPLQSSDLQDSKNQIHFILGDKDKMVTKDETIEFVSNLSHAQFHELEAQPHLLVKIEPQILATRIRQLLNI